MKNKVVVIAVIVVLAIGGYFAGTQLSKKKSEPANTEARNFSDSRNDGRNWGRNIPRPDRDADIRGIVQSVGENKLVVGTFDISANRSFGGNRSPQGSREHIQSLSDEEREAQGEQQYDAFREREVIGEATIAIATKTKIFKSGGMRDRQGNGGDAPEEGVSLDAVAVGDNVLLWTTKDDTGAETAEFIIITNDHQ